MIRSIEALRASLYQKGPLLPIFNPQPPILNLTRAKIPQIHPKLMRSPRWSIIIAALSFCFALQARADAFTDSIADVVAQITNMVGGPSAIALTAKNVSSLNDSQFRDLRAGLQAELHRQKFQLVESTQAVAEVTVTLSENAAGYLWVIQSGKEGHSQVTMVAVPAAATAAISAAAPVMSLRKTLLLTLDDPILDAAVLDSSPTGSHLLILAPDKVLLYSVHNGQSTLDTSQPLLLPKPLPRDVRGRLLLRRDHLFDAYLPGVQCSSTGQGIAAVQCRASDDPWPLATDGSLNAFFATTRNYYTGVLSGADARGRQATPFFSAARVTENGSDLWLLAGLDGRVRYFNGFNETAAPVSGWGSDIAGVKSSCDAGAQILATRPGDTAVSDGVQAYETVRREVTAVSSPVDFSGPVTALWTAADETTVTAVTRNLASGRYEAYSLAISCR